MVSPDSILAGFSVKSGDGSKELEVEYIYNVIVVSMQYIYIYTTHL